MEARSASDYDRNPPARGLSHSDQGVNTPAEGVDRTGDDSVMWRLHGDTSGNTTHGHCFVPNITDDSARQFQLAVKQQAHFQEGGDVNVLNDAIVKYRVVLDMLSQDHPNRLTSLRNLANCLRLRFELHGDPQDLIGSIDYHTTLIERLPPKHPLQASCCFTLAALLWKKFTLQGDSQDLDNSIALYRDSLLLRPHGHPDRILSLDNLATSLFSRYEQRRNLQDLEEVITHYRDIISLLPQDREVDRASFLNKLDHALQTRLDHQGHHQIVEARNVIDEAFDVPRPPANDFPFRNELGIANGRGLGRHDRAGSFANVWEGEWLGRDVAVKKISKAEAKNHDANRELVEWTNSVMHMEDTSLDLDLSQTFRDVVAGFQDLRRQPSMCHGDLKGEHVVMSSSPRVKLSDFGLSPTFDTSIFSSDLDFFCWKALEIEYPSEPYTLSFDLGSGSFGMVKRSFTLENKGLVKRQYAGGKTDTLEHLKNCRIPKTFHKSLRDDPQVSRGRPIESVPGASRSRGIPVQDRHLHAKDSVPGTSNFYFGNRLNIICAMHPMIYRVMTGIGLQKWGELATATTKKIYHTHPKRKMWTWSQVLLAFKVGVLALMVLLPFVQRWDNMMTTAIIHTNLLRSETQVTSLPSSHRLRWSGISTQLLLTLSFVMSASCAMGIITWMSLHAMSHLATGPLRARSGSPSRFELAGTSLGYAFLVLPVLVIRTLGRYSPVKRPARARSLGNAIQETFESCLIQESVGRSFSDRIYPDSRNTKARDDGAAQDPSFLHPSTQQSQCLPLNILVTFFGTRFEDLTPVKCAILHTKNIMIAYSGCAHA